MTRKSVISFVSAAVLALAAAAGSVLAASSTTMTATPQEQTANAAGPSMTIERVMTVKSLETKPVNLASKIMGSPVYTVGGKKVDDVADIVFDNNHKMIALTVGVGGFLGMDETYVAIPMKDITFSSVTNKLEVMTDLTKADLRAATAKA
jgi:sporulation protein YlmC with PRC-barrel domain